MPTQPNSLGLLEYLARELEAVMLSDLRDPTLRAVLLRLIRQIPPERYSPTEWRDALCYLLLPLPPHPPLDNPPLG